MQLLTLLLKKVLLSNKKVPKMISSMMAYLMGLLSQTHNLFNIGYHPLHNLPQKLEYILYIKINRDLDYMSCLLLVTRM